MSCFLLLLFACCCCAVVVCFAAVTRQRKNLSSHFRLDANFFFNVNFFLLDFCSSILFFHSLLFAVSKQLVRWESCMLSQEQDKTRRECRRRDLSFLSSPFHAVLSSAGPKWEEVGVFQFGESDAFFDNVILCSSPLSPLSSLSFGSSFSIRERGRMFFLWCADSL